MKQLFALFRRKPSPSANMTPRVQQVLVVARNEAERRFHQYVGSEHLWGALISYNEGVAVDILRRLKVDFTILQKDYQAAMHAEEPREPKNSIPSTPDFRAVLAKGEKEAKKLGFAYFGTEHLLLGLLSVKGFASDSLASQGVDLTRYRDELIQQIQKKEA